MAAQKRRPRPLKMEAVARTPPPRTASFAGSSIFCATLITSCAMGESLDKRPIPAVTFKKSMPQSMYHWRVLLASFQLKESAALTADAAGLKPLGTQPAGGFFNVKEARTLQTK